jgi:hypothetical protein
MAAAYKAIEDSPTNLVAAAFISEILYAAVRGRRTLEEDEAAAMAEECA